MVFVPLRARSHPGPPAGTGSTPSGRRVPWPLSAGAVVLVATVAQLAIGALVPGLPQFSGKAFGARLAAYPAAMLLAPTAWLVTQWVRGGRRAPNARRDPPWGAFTLIGAPFLIDVTGNTLDLYDTVAWWDDANHLVNWFLLCAGIGLLLARTVPGPGWVLPGLVTGIGALLAIGWELAEWYTFIRHGTELDTAYQDTLGDEALGVLGAALAAGVVAWRADVQGPGAAADRLT